MDGRAAFFMAWFPLDGVDEQSIASKMKRLAFPFAS